MAVFQGGQGAARGSTRAALSSTISKYDKREQITAPRAMPRVLGLGPALKLEKRIIQERETFSMNDYGGSSVSE